MTDQPHQAASMAEVVAIQKALAAGPLSGPWIAVRDFSQWRISNHETTKNGYQARVAGIGSPGRLKTSRLEASNAATAAFVAACNPAAITAVLARIAALEAKLREKEAGTLTDEQIDALQEEYDCFGQCDAPRLHDFARGVEAAVRAAMASEAAGGAA